MTGRRVIARVTTRAVVVAVVTVLALGASFALGARYGGERVRSNDVWADGRLLSTAIDSVRANALDSLPSDELIRRAVSGMLRELQDPYAALLRPESYRTYRGSLLGEGQGLGMSLRAQGAVLSVRRVAAGSPAATAGVRRGDRILMWNGISADDLRRRSAADSSEIERDRTDLVLQRSPAGDSVRVSVSRHKWHMPAVTDMGLLADSVGYVRLTTLSQQSAGELEDAVVHLTRHGARALVLDLRGNGGGLYEEGVKAAGLFLHDDALVSSLAGRDGAPTQQYRARSSRWPTMPMTVLVDGGTASSAEVIAAALREHGRALLVGAPTFGKGVVQRVVRLTPDLSLRLTTARWLTPTGRMLDRREGPNKTFTGGLRPDVPLAYAGWRDLSAIPRAWPDSIVTILMAAVDSATVTAVREAWPLAPVTELEAKIRAKVGTRAPVTSRELWADVVTRLATSRVLELRGSADALLRYSIQHDGALRMGLSLLQPESAIAARDSARSSSFR